jgi:hypothetical protein
VGVGAALVIGFDAGDGFVEPGGGGFHMTTYRENGAELL